MKYEPFKDTDTWDIWASPVQIITDEEIRDEMITSIIRPMLSKEQIDLCKSSPTQQIIATLRVHDQVVAEWRNINHTKS